MLKYSYLRFMVSGKSNCALLNYVITALALFTLRENLISTMQQEAGGQPEQEGVELELQRQQQLGGQLQKQQLKFSTKCKVAVSQ